MKKELKSWRSRVEAKNRAAEKEREKREKILAEVKFSAESLGARYPIGLSFQL
jgi:hypothetical protein